MAKLECQWCFCMRIRFSNEKGFAEKIAVLRDKLYYCAMIYNCGRNPTVRLFSGTVFNQFYR